jgi:hypothetical protein
MGGSNIRAESSNWRPNSFLFPVPTFSNDNADTSSNIFIIILIGEHALDQSDTLPSAHEYEPEQAQALSITLTNRIALYTYYAWKG